MTDYICPKCGGLLQAEMTVMLIHVYPLTSNTIRWLDKPSETTPLGEAPITQMDVYCTACGYTWHGVPYTEDEYGNVTLAPLPVSHTRLLEID